MVETRTIFVTVRYGKPLLIETPNGAVEVSLFNVKGGNVGSEPRAYLGFKADRSIPIVRDDAIEKLPRKDGQCSQSKRTEAAPEATHGRLSAAGTRLRQT